MKLPEVWPFITDDGNIIQENRFYGFYDAGGVMGGVLGYSSKTSAIADAFATWGHTEVSAVAEDLGAVHICVLSGREFIDQLYDILNPTRKSFSNPEDISDFGQWSNK